MTPRHHDHGMRLSRGGVLVPAPFEERMLYRDPARSRMPAPRRSPRIGPWQRPPLLLAPAAAKVGFGTSSSNTMTTSSGTTSNGSAFAFVAAWDNTTEFNAISDTKGNTWTAVGTEQLDGTGARLRWWVALTGLGGAGHTVTWSSLATSFCTGSLYEITGVDLAAIQQATNSQDASGQPFQHTSGANGSGNWLALCACSNNTGSDGAYSADATSPAFTLLHSEGTVSSFWTHGVSAAVSSGTGAVTPSFSRSGTAGTTSAMSYIAFNEAAITFAGHSDDWQPAAALPERLNLGVW